MPYTAYTAIYRAVGPALGICIYHIQHIHPYTPYTGQWGLLWGSLYAIYSIYSHIHHIQGSGASSRGLYIPYTAIYTIYRAVGPALGICMCHIQHQ